MLSNYAVFPQNKTFLVIFAKLSKIIRESKNVKKLHISETLLFFSCSLLSSLGSGDSYSLTFIACLPHRQPGPGSSGLFHSPDFRRPTLRSAATTTFHHLSFLISGSVLPCPLSICQGLFLCAFVLTSLLFKGLKQNVILIATNLSVTNLTVCCHW